MAAKKPASNKAAKLQPDMNKSKLVFGGLLVLVGVWILWQGYFVRNNDQVMPSVKVSSWLNKSKPVNAGATAKIYDLQKNFPDAVISKFAENLVGSVKIDRKDDVAYGFKFGTDASVDTAYTFNSKTGSFSYIGQKQLPGDEKLETVVNKFVQSLVPDLSISASSSYKRRDKPGMVFVELHRDWQAVGLPILSSLGLLNLSESKSLSDLSLAASSNGVRNDNIFATTDNSDGFARQTDFNSITVGLNEADSSLISIDSNFRQLKSNNGQDTKLISYEQATDILTANKYKFLHTTPSGEGVPAFDKVYPTQNVEINQAVITEATVAYLEEMPGVEQSRLEPYYVFRGNATLASGYDVRFVAGVPATKQSKGFSLSKLWNTESAQAVEDGPGGSGGIITPVNPPPPPVVNECIPAVSDLTNIRSVGSDIKIGQLTAAGASKVRGTVNKKFVDLAAKEGDWYVFPVNAQLTAQDIVDAMAAAKGADPTVTTRNTMTVQSLLTKQNRQACPNRITGKSPTIFVYGAAGSAVTINPGGEVTYSNPGLQQGEWRVVLGHEELLVNGLSRPYIYYEYQNVDFVKPATGWVVKKSELSELARMMGVQLRLNTHETDRLLFELGNAAESIESERVFVGPLDNSEISSKLPLKVDGSSILERRHFYVGKADAIIYTNPKLVPVQRAESMVLELGAVTGR